MAEEKKIATGYIGNALRSSAANHTTTFADEIFDTERQQYQNEVNNIVGTYIENPEFLSVKTDAEGKLLWWIEKDGSVNWSKGVPQPIQVKLQELEQKIKGNADDDKTLTERVTANEAAIIAINEVLDNYKVEVAEALSKKMDGEYIENPEFIHVLTDSEGRVLWGLLKNGKVLYGAGIPEQIATLIEEIYDTFGRYTDNPEFIEAKCDNAGRLIYGVLTDGDFKFGKIPSQITMLVNNLKEELTIHIDAFGEWVDNPEFSRVYTDSDGRILDYTDKNGKRWIHDLHADNIPETFSEIEDVENRISMELDPSGKILSYRDKDGILHENCGIITPSVEITDKILLNNSAKSSLVNTIKSNMEMPYMTRKFNLPDYGSIDIICEIYYLGTDGKEYNPTKVTKVNDVYYVTSTLTKVTDPETSKVSYVVNEGSISTTYTEIDVNLEDEVRWPVNKNKHYCKVKLCFGEINDIYYANVSFQGASTLLRPKKGLRITTYKDISFSKKQTLKIGEMVETSKFNVKAYYGDPTRVRDIVLQRLVVEARYLRDYLDQYPWNEDYPINTGAVGTIQSFPVLLTTSGNFYGVSFMGLAKDKKNFMLDGDDTGMIISGDNAGEDYPLSFAVFHPETWSDEMNDDEELTEHGHTPSNYQALTNFFDWINNGVWDKGTVPQHLSVIDWIDYYIFVQVFRMRDNDIHNIILYTKSDKTKFYAFLYDMDLSWGYGYSTDMPINEDRLILWKKFVELYWDEIVDRYIYLRSTVLNYNHVSNLITNIQSSIRYSDFKKEMEKWNEINYTNATYSMLTNFKSCLEHFDNIFINNNK